MTEGRVTQQVMELLKTGGGSEGRVTQQTSEVMRHDNIYTDRMCSDSRSDWTERHYPTHITEYWYAREGAECGYEIFVSAANLDSWKFYSYDPPGTHYNMDVIAMLRQESNLNYSGDDKIGGIAVRYSGEEGYANGYVLQFLREDGTDYKYIALSRVLNGSDTTLATIPASPSGSVWELSQYLTDIINWYFFRLRVEGNQLKAKFWSVDENQPDSWQIETTDSAVSGEGWAGTVEYRKGGYSYGIGYFSVGVNGEEADETLFNPDAYVTQNAVQVIRYGIENPIVTQFAAQVIRFHEKKPVVTQLQELALSGELNPVDPWILVPTQTVMKIPTTM